MNERLNLNIDDSIEKNEKEQLKAITLEVIISDKNILDKIYKNINSPEFDEDKEIDFGPEYQKTNIHTIIFYLYYYFGLFPLSETGNENVKEYLKILHDNPNKADEFLEKAYLMDGSDQNNPDYVLEIKKEAEARRNRGFDLSTIIPDMPSLVMDEINEKEENLEFLGRGTGKVQDIIKGEYSHEDEERIKMLKEFFKGKTVVELGAGYFPNGLEVCDILEAGNYIAVEPYNAEKLLNQIGVNFNDVKNINKIHVAKTDMLTFLSHIPDKTDNLLILISGIDNLIIGTSIDANSYHTKVEKEISQKLSTGGIVVCYASGFVFTEDDGFERIGTFDGFESKINIYRKK